MPERFFVKIIIDVMSGDNAPLALLQGAIMAAEEYRVPIAVVGDRQVIERVAAEAGLSLSSVEIVHADGVIDMEDKPLAIIHEKSESSMGVGLRMLQRGEGDAFVSAGNTGALLAGATLLVRRIKGIRRAAIATVLPFSSPVLLMDAGANLVVTPDDLEQFAYMGSFYMKNVHGLPSPRVGLLNNGTEQTKGLPLQIAANERLTANGELCFVGNVESKELPFGCCDVLLTDGFTGNIVLKYTEGMGKFMLSTLKQLFTQNAVTKVAALSMKKHLSALKKQFDASEYGGAPLLGISKPVIKAHGSSDARAICNAILRAKEFAESNLIADVEANIDMMKVEKVELPS
jgi:glycerol-3-phosphate acyltransferase PlsX